VKRLFVVLCAALLVAGCATAPVAEGPGSLARFHLESAEATGIRVTLPRSGSSIAVAEKPVLTEYDIVGIDIAQVSMGKCLLFRLTPAAARDLRKMTQANPGQRLVLRVDERACGARRIDETIDDGRLFIFVERPDEELPALQRALEKTARRMHGVQARL